MGIGTLGGGDLFRWDLKTPCIKNSEYKSQAKKKKNDSDCISTISHFSSPTHALYSPLPTNIFFVGG